MEPNNDKNIAKPKIAKHTSNKLPDVFKTTRVSQKKGGAIQPQQSNPNSEIDKQKVISSQEEKQSKARNQSRNPFLPMREYFKMAQKMELELREANLDFNMERFAKYSIGEDEPKEKSKEKSKESKLKYENCITLCVIFKNSSGCLKKILYVPTMTVYYIKESQITMQIDKNDLTSWIETCNRSNSGSCIKIAELIWNMPLGYYSLLYEYSEGILLEQLTDQINSLPVWLLREISKAYLSSELGIFNSQLILSSKGEDQIQVRYLPLYEEKEVYLNNSFSQSLQNILQNQLSHSQEEQTENKLLWRLGLTLLVGYLGEIIVDQDIQLLHTPIQQCCLLHSILETYGSLSKTYLQENHLQDQNLIDFICKCLTSKKFTSKVQPTLKMLRTTRFIQKKIAPQIANLSQIVSVVDPASECQSKFEISKMNKILDAVGLILQNANLSLEMNISSENEGIQQLAKELGLGNHVQKMVQELKKVIESEKR